MLYMIFGIALGLFFFIATIKAYTIGLKHGKQLANKEVPTINLNPIKAYTEHKEEKEAKTQRELELEGIANIFSYTGDEQK